jgi:DNA-binding response OmpR family regulator
MDEPTPAAEQPEETDGAASNLSADQPVSDQPVASAPLNPTILLVEDDRILQELYYERFTISGLSVIQAFDGMQALEELEQHPEVQLILLDIMLPKLSGYDVLARIKRDASKKHLPVIIVSALADIDDQAKGLQLGAAEYITKGEMLPGAVIDRIKSYVLSVPRPAE